jgi:hypothetical protein
MYYQVYTMKLLFAIVRIEHHVIGHNLAKNIDIGAALNKLLIDSPCATWYVRENPWYCSAHTC